MGCITGFKNFTAEPQDQIVDVGSNARFDCRYEPKELVATWFKETENVKYAFKPGRLVIDSVSLVILEVETTDVGRYTCRVANNERAAKLSVSTASKYMEEMYKLYLLSLCHLFFIRQ